MILNLPTKEQIKNNEVEIKGTTYDILEPNDLMNKYESLDEYFIPKGWEITFDMLKKISSYPLNTEENIDELLWLDLTEVKGKMCLKYSYFPKYYCDDNECKESDDKMEGWLFEGMNELGQFLLKGNHKTKSEVQ
jgi:hypothetical protein